MIDDLERRIWTAETRTLRLEQAGEAARQTGIQNRQTLAQLTTINPTICIATMLGYVDSVSCNNLLSQPVLTMTVTDYFTSAVYGVYQSTGGPPTGCTAPAAQWWTLISGSMQLPGNLTKCLITVTFPPGFTLDGGGGLSNPWTDFMECGDNAADFGLSPFHCSGGTREVMEFRFKADTGYTCTPCGAIATATTYTLTDSVYAPGGVTLTWNGSVWTFTQAVTYPGCSGCPADTNVTIVYSVNVNYVLTIQMLKNGPGCPTHVGGFGTALGIVGGVTRTSLTCSPVSAAWSVTTSKFYCTAATITLS